MLIRTMIALALIALAVSSCGFVQSKKISNVQNQQELRKYTNRALCNRYVDVTHGVAAERRRSSKTKTNKQKLILLIG